MRRTVFLTLLVIPAIASAQTSTMCHGGDPARGESLNPRIRTLYESATGHSRLRRTELEAVMTLATEQCQAGDDRGLIWRAAARFALACDRDGGCEQPDEATREALQASASDLDGYLIAHPPASLSRGQLEFINPLGAGLSRYVTRVRVVARPPGVVVRVGDLSTPLDEATATVGTPGAVLPRRRPWRPLAIAASVTAATLAVAGLGFTIWREAESADYVSSGCTSRVDAGCLSTYDQFDTAKSLQLASLVTASVFVGGAVALWLLDRRGGSQPRRGAAATTGCDAHAGGIRCSW